MPNDTSVAHDGSCTQPDNGCSPSIPDRSITMSGEALRSLGFLTVSEVAQLLRVSKMTVYRLIHANDLPAISIRGTYRVRVAALDELLESETTHPDHSAVCHAG